MPASSAIMAASRRPLRLLLCATVAAALYLPALGRPALWEPDEGRYAEIAREMVLTHDYVTPHDDWVRYFEKPPLVYWTETLSIRLFGVNELAVRLPAALATVAAVWSPRHLARRCSVRLWAWRRRWCSGFRRWSSASPDLRRSIRRSRCSSPQHLRRFPHGRARPAARTRHDRPERRAGDGSCWRAL